MFLDVNHKLADVVSASNGFLKFNSHRFLNAVSKIALT